MYTAKYEVKVEKRPSVQPTVTTVLKAEFRFSDEVHQGHCLDLERNYGIHELPEYFNIVEKAALRNNPSFRAQTQLYCDAEREIKVKPFVFSFGFKVEVTSKKPLPLEQMLNLEALNQFVLTGEVKGEKFLSIS